MAEAKVTFVQTKVIKIWHNEYLNFVSLNDGH